MQRDTTKPIEQDPLAVPATDRLRRETHEVSALQGDPMQPAIRPLKPAGPHSAVMRLFAARTVIPSLR